MGPRSARAGQKKGPGAADEAGYAHITRRDRRVIGVGSHRSAPDKPRARAGSKTSSKPASPPSNTPARSNSSKTPDDGDGQGDAAGVEVG